MRIAESAIKRGGGLLAQEAESRNPGEAQCSFGKALLARVESAPKVSEINISNYKS